MSSTSLELAVEIAAPVDDVWNVLADFSAYPQWHPHIASASGELRPGGQIRVRSAGPVAASLDVAIVQVDAPHVLVTEGGDPEHLIVRHHWELSALPNGATRVDDHETFLGPHAAAMFAQHSEAMRSQLVPIMDALKAAAESRRRFQEA
jgi:uncharacterized protein YndB with AHSA1/START domain